MIQKTQKKSEFTFLECLTLNFPLEVLPEPGGFGGGQKEADETHHDGRVGQGQDESHPKGQQASGRAEALLPDGADRNQKGHGNRGHEADPRCLRQDVLKYV